MDAWLLEVRVSRLCTSPYQRNEAAEAALEVVIYL